MMLLGAAAARALRLPPATNRVTREPGVRLPASDGVELATDLYLAAPLGPRPTVLIRSPYGRGRLVWGGLAALFAGRGGAQPPRLGEITAVRRGDRSPPADGSACSAKSGRAGS